MNIWLFSRLVHWDKRIFLASFFYLFNMFFFSFLHRKTSSKTKRENYLFIFLNNNFLFGFSSVLAAAPVAATVVATATKTEEKIKAE